MVVCCVGHGRCWTIRVGRKSCHLPALHPQCSTRSLVEPAITLHTAFPGWLHSRCHRRCTSLVLCIWCLDCSSSVVSSRVYLFVSFPNPANCRKRNFGRNFANSERKENSNSKNEIPMNSDRNFGDSDRNSVIFDRKMMSVVIFLLFPRSNEKLLNTNFVQFFEIYNFCFRNFFI